MNDDGTKERVIEGAERIPGDTSEARIQGEAAGAGSGLRDDASEQTSGGPSDPQSPQDVGTGSASQIGPAELAGERDSDQQISTVDPAHNHLTPSQARDSGGDEQRSETRANPEASHDSVSNGVKEAPAEPESTEKNNFGASNQESAITPKADSADGSPNLAQAANHPLAAEKAQPETAAPADLRVFHPLEAMEQDRPEDESATALDSTGARGSDQPEVAKEFASQAKAILGNAPTVVTARSDPQIPEVLRQSAGGGALERPTDRVFAVQCGNGWSALILTDFNALDTIQAKSSRFATALIARARSAFYAAVQD
jgi:hypothetical protein